MKKTLFFYKENKVPINGKTKIHLEMLAEWGIYISFYYTVLMYYTVPIYLFPTYEYLTFVFTRKLLFIPFHNILSHITKEQNNIHVS